MRHGPVLALLCLSACSGLALDTRVADTPAARAAMAGSVVPGTTTETDLIGRWGRPVQKLRRGAQTEYVYRALFDPEAGIVNPWFGDSGRYVIVTFQYGLATGVRVSDEIDCRATFPPRPPGYLLDNPTQVRLVGDCAGRGGWGGGADLAPDGGRVRPDGYVAGGKASAAGPAPVRRPAAN